MPAPGLRCRTRFNEAPAIPPGKTIRAAADGADESGRFNEAPAIPPGKTSLPASALALAAPLQ